MGFWAMWRWCRSEVRRLCVLIAKIKDTKIGPDSNLYDAIRELHGVFTDLLNMETNTLLGRWFSIKALKIFRRKAMPVLLNKVMKDDSVCDDFLLNMRYFYFTQDEFDFIMSAKVQAKRKYADENEDKHKVFYAWKSILDIAFECRRKFVTNTDVILQASIGALEFAEIKGEYEDLYKHVRSKGTFPNLSLAKSIFVRLNAKYGVHAPGDLKTGGAKLLEYGQIKDRIDRYVSATSGEQALHVPVFLLCPRGSSILAKSISNYAQWCASKVSEMNLNEFLDFAKEIERKFEKEKEFADLILDRMWRAAEKSQIWLR